MIKNILNSMIKGIAIGVGIGIGILATIAIAVTVSTTFSDGDLLTADSLNALKTAIESIPAWRAGDTSGDAAYTTGNVGIGTTDPAGTLDVSGDLCISGSCRSSWGTVSNLWSENGSDIYYNDGNVGIGTISPINKLDIEGAPVANMSLRGDGGGYLRFYGDGSYRGAIGYDGTNNVLMLNHGSGVTANHFVINSSGNVGIGKLSPEVKLHVSKHMMIGTDSNPWHSDYDVLQIGGMGFFSEDNKNGSLYLLQNAYFDGSYKYSTSSYATRYSQHSGEHVFLFASSGTAGSSVPFTEGMKIQNDGDIEIMNGNVGIGTSSPDHDLEIGTGTYSEIDAGESSFTTSSSRTLKENIEPVAVPKILDRLANIPVATYDYRPEYCQEDQKCKNKIGLISEDFYTVFERGSDKEISGQEVQMALWLAVQELTKEKEVMQNENRALKQDIEQIKQALGM